MKIGIIGAGVVGNAVATGLNHKGHEILVYDKIIEKSKNTIKEIKQTELVFICVPTPNTDDGIDLSFIEDSLKNLKDYKGVVAIKSTIPPGTLDYLKGKFDLRLVHCPEFLKENSALEDFLNLDRVIIGSYNREDAEIVVKAHKGFNARVFVTKPRVAESIKLFINGFLATKVIFANEFKAYCDKKDIDYNEVLKGVLLDERIGKSHLLVTKEGGYGGKCFPKDVRNLISSANEAGVKLNLLETADKINQKIRGEI